MFGQPTIAGGRVFFGTQSAHVYALDAQSGCYYWDYICPDDGGSHGNYRRTNPRRQKELQPGSIRRRYRDARLRALRIRRRTFARIRDGRRKSALGFQHRPEVRDGGRHPGAVIWRSHNQMLDRKKTLI